VNGIVRYSQDHSKDLRALDAENGKAQTKKEIFVRHSQTTPVI
jgi:hypothetical protein